MRALVLHGAGAIRLERIPRPVPAAGEVLVRVAACGVCGSDIPRIFAHGAHRMPLVCGHEFAGTVEAVAPGLEDVVPGARVAVFPLLWCGRCPACERGLYVQCRDYDYLGSRRDGAFAEFVAVPRRNLVPVPDAVSLQEAALTEPAAVALHALRRAGPTAGETVAVLGAGPIGLLVAQWARALGTSRILLFDIAAGRLDLARRLGFAEAFPTGEADPVETIASRTGGQGAHVCVEAAGVPATLRQALAAARRGGRVVIVGNPSADVTIPAPVISQVMRREVRVLGTWNARFSAFGGDDDWHTALAAMAAGTIDAKPLITHRVDLEGAIDALAMMRDRSAFFAKVLVRPGGG